MTRPVDDDGEQLSEKEREHLRRRDQKRVTRMVVDNAAVRRIVQAVRGRAQTGSKKKK